MGTCGSGGLGFDNVGTGGGGGGAARPSPVPSVLQPSANPS